MSLFFAYEVKYAKRIESCTQKKISTTKSARFAGRK